MIPFIYAAQEKCVYQAVAAVLVNGTTVFTVRGGPIIIVSLGAVCVTANNATASTLKWQADGTDGSAADICAATSTLANVAAGTIVAAVPGTTATAAAIYANGIGITGTVNVIVPAGIITNVVGTGSTTGTWRQFIRYIPLTPDSTVSG